MKRILQILVFTFPLLLCAQQQNNLVLLSHWDDNSLPVIDGDQVWNDLTGWNDTSSNREYLIAGSNDSVYFFDITDPSVMVKCDVEEGHARNAINRDYDTYGHYLYCVSDRSSPSGSLQIFDLSYLPDSVHKVYDSDTFSINTHTVFIESTRKRMYLCGTTHKPAGVWSMAVFDLSDPVNPQFLGELDKSLGCAYTHEMYARNDTAYCSCGNAGLFIFDLQDMTNQKLLSSITPPYVQNGYNHSSWLDSSGRFMMFTDENQGLGIKIYDMKDFADPQFVTVFNSHPLALPHNAYWKGRFAYVSSYEDGVYIYDLKNIDQYLPSQVPPVAGFYDTYPQNADGVYNGFHGCWGVWPFLRSGNIIASDISEGLFVLKPADNLSLPEAEMGITYVNAWPNPFIDRLSLSIHSTSKKQATLTVLNIHGKTVYEEELILKQGNNYAGANLNHLEAGVYLARITSLNEHVSLKILKQ